MTAQNLVSNIHSHLKRATEFLVVFVFFTNFTFIPLLYLLLFCYTVLFTSLWWIALLYGAYIYVQAGQSELPKSEPNEALRNHWFWNHYGDYFPVKLHKTADLPKDKNYLFGWHPHGILGFGAGVTICGRGPEFIRLFPGITRHVATLDVHFLLPFRRWLMEAVGFIPVSFKSLVYKLSKASGGNAVIVAIGGAEEALEAHPDVYRLCLNRRKGFIRVCLATGAHLVPVYAFGETSTYDQVRNPQGSRLRNFQETVKKYTGVSPPIVFGTSLIPFVPGMLPRRAEINVVFGAPIPIEKTENPSKEKIDELHKLYEDKLVELFEANKLKYGVDKDAHLEFY